MEKKFVKKQELCCSTYLILCGEPLKKINEFLQSYKEKYGKNFLGGKKAAVDILLSRVLDTSA